MLVPRLLWRKSLQTLWPGWRALRRSLIEQRGRICQTYGTRPERLSDFEADEEWSYDTSTDPTVARVPKIVLRCSIFRGAAFGAPQCGQNFIFTS